MAGAESEIGRQGDRFPDASIPRIESQIKRTEFDGTTYEAPTYDQMGKLNFRLARQIIESGQSFDRIIALARGGWTWATDLGGGLEIPEFSSIRYKSYTGIDESGEPRLIQPLTDSIHGERILLFDEVIDSGKTIIAAKNYLGTMGPTSIETASLCYKPRSEVKPDFYAFESNAWVVFPHEIREFVKDSVKKWKPLELSNDEIFDRLVTIGVPYDQAKFYLRLI